MDDPRGALKQADALLKRDDIPGAITLYTSVAHFYAAQGFTLKSIAIWKQILAIDAHNADARSHLITLYRSVGLEADARALEAGK